jgi:hypothetical protein
MSKPNELLGFGGMVSGRLPDVEGVGRALDLAGRRSSKRVPGTWVPATARPTGWPERCPDRWRS